MYKRQKQVSRNYLSTKPCNKGICFLYTNDRVESRMKGSLNRKLAAKNKVLLTAYEVFKFRLPPSQKYPKRKFDTFIDRSSVANSAIICQSISSCLGEFMATKKIKSYKLKRKWSNVLIFEVRQVWRI